MKKKDYYLYLTNKLGILILNLTNTINLNIKSKIILNQIIKGTSPIRANHNYSSVYHINSDAEFISRLDIVKKESDETLYWLEILKNIEMIDEYIFKEIKNIINYIIAFAIAFKKL